ncbi:unnamed protein product, partial [Brassica rapa subsp. trilocularis]
KGEKVPLCIEQTAPVTSDLPVSVLSVRCKKTSDVFPLHPVISF